MSNPRTVKNELLKSGWGEESARFISEKCDDPRFKKVMRRFGANLPRIAPARKKQSIPYAVRWAVWLRDNFTCKRCGARWNLSVDHIIPESKGGTLEQSNLQTLCKVCNSKKGTGL